MSTIFYFLWPKMNVEINSSILGFVEKSHYEVRYIEFVKISLLVHYSHFQHWTRDDSFKLKDLLCSQSCFSEQLPELMPSLESPVSQRSGNPIRWDRRYLRGNVFVEYGVLVFGTAI